MKNNKIFGIINIVDLIVIIAILLAITGLVLVKSGKFKTSGNVIKKEAVIQFDVTIKGQKVSRKENLFKPGEKTFITIRNVPYTSLEIVKSTVTPVQSMIPDPKNPSKAVAVTDPTDHNLYNYLVTLKDNALVTDNGYVIGGNKIKIGLVVDLEGFDYRLHGIVSDVKAVK